MDFKRSIKVETFLFLQSSQLVHLLQRLKFLYLCVSYPDLDYELLNFKRLVHLGIRWNPNIATNGKKTLALLSLRVLSLCNLNFDLAVDLAPRLEVLQCFDIGRVELEHPETKSEAITSFSYLQLKQFQPSKKSTAISSSDS